jgi:uncharacterized membrane protein YoaK (UPF0700 family)
MTGNTVQFASNLVRSNWADAFLAGSVILAFLAGSIVGRAIIEAGARNGFRRVASASLLTEALLLALAGLASVTRVPLRGNRVPGGAGICFAPAVLLAAAVAVDQVSPLSLREEREQMEAGG